ncbi:Cell division and transport-associated protein TolR [Rhizobiales bacterium GAS191]|jgi:biopolymer transport protein TolR|nr:Cell division and transport-associated protein TolR [Rhizobiales bacterium GAS113]SEC46121.1 Cell division and transport-associated protein TolR [Rhizobiales bacterium GAS191]SEC80118.1 Cell division and transport-associated protein TolR [Rhizobiales bacterium GAS188]
MGANVSAMSQEGTGRRRRRRHHSAIAQINMTPFIDVMLVLLIVFMVAAPLLTSGVPLDLPQTGAKPLNVDKQPVTISIDEKGKVFLMEKPVEDAALLDTLKAIAANAADERIYVRGAKQVGYGRVAQIMSMITAAGYKRVALVTEPDLRN